jgi:hypothetical protein
MQGSTNIKLYKLFFIMNGNITYWYSQKGEIYDLICLKIFSQGTKTLRHYNQYFIFSAYQFLTWQQMYCLWQLKGIHVVHSTTVRCQKCFSLKTGCAMSPLMLCIFYCTVHLQCGPGSSVSIATDYGLDGPGIESRWGEIFRPSRPALGPTQPPLQWIPE